MMHCEFEIVSFMRVTFKHCCVIRDCVSAVHVNAEAVSSSFRAWRAATEPLEEAVELSESE